jgi:protein-tyrosine phosphatase
MARRDMRVARVAVDLHCHVLPGLDDGARDLADAVAMARQAQADGIDAICATPHIRHDHDVRIAELPARLAELSTAVRQAGCSTRILPGGEIASTALDGLDDRELAAASLGGGGRWILLEPAPGPLNDDLELAVDRLRSRGFRAVIAHPERHLTADLVPRLCRQVANGALVQATAASMTDHSSREGMLALARAGVVHVLGSDAHSSRAGRPVTLAEALQALGAVRPTAAHLDWIGRTAPLAIVAGRELTAPFPSRLARTSNHLDIRRKR